MTNRITPVVSAWDAGHRSPPVAIDTRAGAIDDALAQWAGNADTGNGPDPLGLSAAQAAIGFYSKAFAMAAIEPASLQPTLTPVALASIARLLLSGGNYVAEIGISDNGALELLPCTDYEIAGNDPQPARWYYQLNYPTPSGGDARRQRPAGGVAHIRINESPAWVGRSPLTLSTLTARYAANLEQSLRRDAATRVLHIIPAPDGTPEARMRTLRTSLSKSEGNATLVETMAAGWQGSRMAAPKSDWTSNRVGPMLPAPNVAAQSAVWNQVVACYGLHPGMWNGAGVDARESQRLAFLNGVLPTAEIVAHVLSDALGATITMSFDRAMYSDLRSRSNAFAQFVAGGLTAQQALVLIGLTEDAPIATTPTPTGDRGIPDTWVEYRRAHGLPELNGNGVV